MNTLIPAGSEVFVYKWKMVRLVYAWLMLMSILAWVANLNHQENFGGVV